MLRIYRTAYSTTRFSFRVTPCHSFQTRRNPRFFKRDLMIGKKEEITFLVTVCNDKDLKHVRAIRTRGKSLDTHRGKSDTFHNFSRPPRHKFQLSSTTKYWYIESIVNRVQSRGVLQTTPLASNFIEFHHASTLPSLYSYPSRSLPPRISRNKQQMGNEIYKLERYKVSKPDNLLIFLGFDWSLYNIYKLKKRKRERKKREKKCTVSLLPSRSQE